jgi:hypothetical protein
MSSIRLWPTCTIASSARPRPEELADKAFDALTQNGYGQFDHLIQSLQPALGPIGLEHLKLRMIALSAQPVRKPTAKERLVVGWSSGGMIYAEHSRVSTVRLTLQKIADAQIARRLLAARRADEASRLRRDHSRKVGFWGMVS